MKKKTALIIGAALLVIAVTGTVIIKQNKQTQTGPEPTPVPKKRITEPVNQIPVSERPYLQIAPYADGHNIAIIVNHLNKPATEMEYELEYQAGSLLQGVFGQVDLNSQLPITEKKLLGSCSAGGACTYHEDVKGGTLLTRFTGGEERYVLKSDWRYIINSARETEFSSRDGKFQLTSDDLATESYLVIFNSPGIPEGLEGELVSEPYALSVVGQLSGKGEVTIRAAETGDNLRIAGYDGESWTEFDSEADGKMVTAKIDLVNLLVVVR